MHSKMRLSDSGPALFGIFDMTVYDLKDGTRKRFRHIHKRNQITNQGREALLDLMRPETNNPGAPDQLQRESKIGSLSVGTNPTPPTLNDDETTMVQVWRGEFYPPGGSLSDCEVVVLPPDQYLLQIGKILPEAAAVGQVLTEAGIFTRGTLDDPYASVGRRLYARQVHPPIPKTGTMTIEYDWKLGISIQGS
jgi:hypothetical protein